jgi:Domain of unknown function (DUF4157)
MGWFQDAADSVSDAVEDVVDTVADAVQNVVDTVSNVVTNAIETAGSVMQKGLDYLANSIGGGFWSDSLKWFGGIISGVHNAIASTLKAAAAITSSTIISGIQLLGGILSFNLDLILKAGKTLLVGITSGIIYVVGSAITFFQKAFFLQSLERGLTKEEQLRLKKVFHNSVILFNIRIVEGNTGLYAEVINRSGNSNTAAFTLGNTIYILKGTASEQFKTLVHECVHVWQYQNYGARYAAEALIAQQSSNESGYEWIKELEEKGKTNWLDFNREAQSQFIEDVWFNGKLILNGVENKEEGIFYELDIFKQNLGVNNVSAKFEYGKNQVQDFTDFAIASIEDMRNI